MQTAPEPVAVVELSSNEQVSSIFDAKLREELLAMMEKDQNARGRTKCSKDKETIETSAKLDRQHAERMKQIVAEHGWPTRGMVNDDGAQAAWLLVQHADHDVSFQRKCLELMKAAVPRNEVFKGNVAYLTDRVLVNEGKPQIYGTQFHVANGKHQPRPMIEPDKIDKRRAEMGLTTLKEYTEFMRT